MIYNSSISDRQFAIRSYGRTELAQMYNPNLSANAAWRKLKAWISYSPGLADRLRAMGCDGRSRTWPPSAVRMIVDALGEP